MNPDWFASNTKKSLSLNPLSPPRPTALKKSLNCFLFISPSLLLQIFFTISEDELQIWLIACCLLLINHCIVFHLILFLESLVRLKFLLGRNYWASFFIFNMMDMLPFLIGCASKLILLFSLYLNLPPFLYFIGV